MRVCACMCVRSCVFVCACAITRLRVCVCEHLSVPLPSMNACVRDRTRELARPRVAPAARLQRSTASSGVHPSPTFVQRTPSAHTASTPTLSRTVQGRQTRFQESRESKCESAYTLCARAREPPGSFKALATSCVTPSVVL